jgi:hypothetical protein
MERETRAKWRRTMPLHVHEDTAEEQQDEADSLSDSDAVACETQDEDHDGKRGATTRRGTRYGAPYAKQLRRVKAAPRDAARRGRAAKNGAHDEDDEESMLQRARGDCGVKTKRRKRKATYHVRKVTSVFI